LRSIAPMNTEEKILTMKKPNLIKILAGKMFNKKMFKSFSVWSVLFSNFLIALFTIIENESVLNVLWIYWFQSVIIGVFNFFKIISLNDFTVDGLKMNNKLLTNSKAAKASVAIFFLFHYGFFHFVYAIFLFAFFSMNSISNGGIDVVFILLTSLVFFINYLVEFIFSFRREQSIVQSLPKLMMAPYKRIIPMHLTIILSGFVLVGGAVGVTNSNVVILLIFIGLKTLMDLFSHSY
jgi:hypothetical protein